MSTQQQSNTPEFSKIRSLLWPIYNFEMKKFVPLAIIMFCVLGNYTIMRDTKDSLIATAAGAGPEAIPYLKGIFVMTSAMLFVVLYTKLSNVFSAQKLFHGIVGTFLAFFALFCFVIYPNIETLHPSIETVNNLQQTYPNFKFAISVWGVWSYSLFYIMSELWGSVMISLLFWQFANEITRTREASRFYPLLVMISNISLMCSGKTVNILSDIRKTLPADVDAWGVTLHYLGIAIIVLGVVAMFVYQWMQKNVLSDPKYYDAAAPKAKKKSKPKLSIGESFKYLLSSPYIAMIAVLVLSYGMSINLIEIIWKKQLSIMFKGDPNGYNAFMGNFSFFTGLATILIIYATKNVVNRFGWFVGAVITPTALAITGGLFFAMILFKDIVEPLYASFGASALSAAVWIGMVQNIATKGSKYSFFDPTKEMAYIPLDQELKVKGKAAVDVIGGRLGKAMGGWTLIAIFSIFAVRDVMTVVPYLAIIIAIITLAWFFAVGSLARKYKVAVAEKEEELKQEKEAA